MFRLLQLCRASAQRCAAVLSTLRRRSAIAIALRYKAAWRDPRRRPSRPRIVTE